MTGIDSLSSGLVVSTIHKVKGLEYDRVVIVPSTASIVVTKGDALEAKAADETRLFYVAMTRAKQHLTFAFGDREKAWWKGKAYDGFRGKGKILQGSSGEVVISWSAQTRNGGIDLQEYIKRHVAKNDSILINGFRLFYINGAAQREIGRLTRKFSGDENSTLRVAGYIDINKKKITNTLWF